MDFEINAQKERDYRNQWEESKYSGNFISYLIDLLANQGDEIGRLRKSDVDYVKDHDKRFAEMRDIIGAHSNTIRLFKQLFKDLM